MGLTGLTGYDHAFKPAATRACIVRGTGLMRSLIAVVGSLSHLSKPVLNMSSTIVDGASVSLPRGLSLSLF